MTGRFYIRSILRIAFACMLFLACCITQYIPDLNENEELLVVEGLITDQPGPNTVTISRTLPIWTRDFRTPLEGCTVWITDDMGNIDSLKETKVGMFITDSATFTGLPGRKYTLHLTAWTREGWRNYESLPMEMKPVPPVDSIYYEKRNFRYNNLPAEGCEIFLDTHDPSGSCKFYRWNYKETWEFRLPFDVENKICWINSVSNEIFIKNTSLLSEDRIMHFPLKLIANPVDRLGVKYSILVSQYSLNENEYCYWEKLGNTVVQVGGLYDIIPSTVPGNIFCIEDNLEKVLGFFSVSSVKSKRFFIQDKFIGMNGMYLNCAADSTVYGTDPIEGLNVTWWVIYDYTDSVPPVRLITSKRYCGDCTLRGTNKKPDFWDNDK